MFGSLWLPYHVYYTFVRVNPTVIDNGEMVNTPILEWTEMNVLIISLKQFKKEKKRF